MDAIMLLAQVCLQQPQRTTAQCSSGADHVLRAEDGSPAPSSFGHTFLIPPVFSSHYHQRGFSVFRGGRVCERLQ